MNTSGIWGSFTVYPARFGVTRYHLVVFPPGISAPQRRALRLWRAWPLWGAALWVGLQVGGSLVGMPETALIGGTMLVIGCGAMAFALTGEMRWQVRSRWAVSMAGYSDRELDDRYRTLKAMAHTLDLADLALSEGRISPVAYEARWWAVYDALAETAAPDSRVSHSPSAAKAATSKPAIARSTKPSGISLHHD